METVSVILQVASFKLTGKRIFAWRRYTITLSLKAGQNQELLYAFGLLP